ncbi:MucR family transcriptional regulator [Novosphingobium huizhouense]|uniref:MucR family transcriptional regulator n=1 Tax=Novosphingobium huizhouense TaxID=2866625 RepID=UPI001CD8CD06|nr:MucR family transcriptional regulator [Novosphingobium huizhouense]
MNSLLSNAQLFELDPAQVDEGKRIGFLHQDKAAAIGRLMKVDGQRDPIKVVAQPKNTAQPWRLVTGMHRLIGARLEGIAVWAIEVAGKPEDLADLEASENLHRRPLAPIERAKFTAALVQAAQERIARAHGNLSHQKLGAKLRWERVKAHETRPDAALTEEVSDAYATMAQVYGWEESVGEALGMSRRSIHRDLELFRLLIEPFGDVIEQLARHPVVGENASQLRAIAQVREEADRRRVIEALLADPEIGADDARIAVGIDSGGGRKPSQEEKAVSAVVGNLGRLSAPQQKRYVSEIAKSLKSDEVKRQLRDVLNEQLGDAPVTPPKPAVLVRQSVKPDHLVCLDCGEKMERLMPHIREAHGLSMVKYLARWDLPMDYPFTAPNLTLDEDEA